MNPDDRRTVSQSGLKRKRLFRLDVRRNVPNEVDLELQHHIEERTDRLIAQGWDPAAARAEARRRFGDHLHFKHECEVIMTQTLRQSKAAEHVRSVLQDLRYAVRSLRHAPLFGFTLIGTLGLGIGANIAIFAVIDAALFRPLAFEHPEDLFGIEWVMDEAQGFRVPQITASRLEALTDVLNDIPVGVNAREDFDRTDNQPESVRVQGVNRQLFDVLGVSPRYGRTFTAEDFGANPVGVLSHETAVKWFGSAEAATGQTIRLDDSPVVIVGVMPPSFRYPTLFSANVFIPFGPDHSLLGTTPDWFRVAFRWPHENAQQLQERLDIARTALDANPPSEGFGSWIFTAVPLDNSRPSQTVRQSLLLLTGAVAAMMLVAIVNGINLMLARGASRTREIAIRLSIGASRGRLTRQFLTEGIVFGMLSGVVALGVATTALNVLSELIPSSVSNFTPHTIGIETRVLTFAFAVSLMTGVIVGLLPAVRLTRQRGTSSQIAQVASAPRTEWFRRGLIVTEVAVSLALTVAGGLFVASFLRLANVDLGFVPANLAYVQLSLQGDRYSTDESKGVFSDELQRRLRALPGVRSVARADGMPPNTSVGFGGLEAFDNPREGTAPEYIIPFLRTDTAFLSTMQIELIAGRNFVPGDDRSVAIIDETTATLLWANESPLGKRFRIGSGGWRTVVGVIPELRLNGADDRNSPYDIIAFMAGPPTQDWIEFAVRAEALTPALMSEMRAAVGAIDPILPVRAVESAEAALADNIDGPRFLWTAMVSFAFVAVAIAIFGIYGVLAFLVGRRRREIGVRIAIGATATRVRGMILREGLILTSVGVALGTIGVLVGENVLAAQLFGVSALNPVILIGASLLMLSMGLAASYAPAHRATQIQPTEVLRTE